MITPALAQQIESLIREGSLDEAKNKFSQVKIREIPRPLARDFANLARRIGLTKVSLKILNPIVRGDDQSIPDATAEENIQYAASLRSAGVVPEAVEILESLDARIHPTSGFHLALCYIAQWRYGAAIPLLENYARSFRQPCYELYVCKTNLLAALIHEDHVQAARMMVKEVLAALDPVNFDLLYRVNLELAAQLAVVTGELDAALVYLDNARSLEKKARGSVYALTTAKWTAVVHSMKAGGVAPDLLAVREQAAELGESETVRDCEFYIGKLASDSKMLARVYFGTPYPSFRKKILDALGPTFKLPEYYLWGPRDRSQNSRIFNLASGRTHNGNISLPAGQELHRFLIAMSLDFYRPVSVLSLFSILFPKELFHPETSRDRVHHVIARFRRWIEKETLPLTLSEASGEFQLGFKGTFSIAIPADSLPMDQKELEFLRLRSSLKTQGTFTTQDAVRSANYSRSAVQRLLRWAIESNKVAVEGQNHKARYRFV